MTIQQHASFDSSAAELNATSKLVKAWESKNAKNAAKAGGISMMALSLAACGGSSTTVTTPVVETPVVDTPVVDAATASALQISSVTGTFDNLEGGSGADTFTAGSGALETGDAIDGKGGSDTLTATYTADASVIASVSNVETINVRAYGNDVDVTLDMDSISGATSVNAYKVDNVAAANTASVTVNNLALGTDVGVVGGAAAAASAGDVTFTFKSTTGTSDAATVNLDAALVNDVTIAGIETLTINSGGASANLLADLVVANASTINVTGSQDLTITAEVDMADTSVVTTGAIDGTVDASAMTGALSFTPNASDNMKITGGSGNDTFAMTSGLDKYDILDGGAGTDTVSINALADDATVDASTYSFSNIETLSVQGAAGGAEDPVDLTIAIDAAGISTLVLVESQAHIDGVDGTDEGTFTVTGLSSGNTIELVNDKVDADDAAEVSQIGAVTLSLLDGSGTADSLTVELKGTTAQTAAENTVDDLAITDVETLNIVSSHVGTTAASVLTATDDNTLGDISADTKLTTLNISGSDQASITVGSEATKLATVNTAGMSNDLSLTLAATVDQTVTGGSAKETVAMGSTLNNADTVDLAGGTDVLSATVTGLTATTGALKISNVETLNLTNGGTAVIDATAITGASEIAILTNTTKATITGLAADTAVGLGFNDTDGDVDGIVDVALADATGTADTLTVNLNDTREASTNTVDLRTTGVETVALVYTDTTDTALANTALDVDAINAATLTVTGANGDVGHTLGLGTLDTDTTTVDASGYHGIMTVAAGAATATAITARGDVLHSITGSSKNDTFTISTATTAADMTINGNGGTDTLNMVLGTGAQDFDSITDVDTINFSASGTVAITTAAAGALDGINEATAVTFTGGNSISTITLGGTALLTDTNTAVIDLSGFAGALSDANWTVDDFDNDGAGKTIQVIGTANKDTVSASYSGDTNAAVQLNTQGVEVFDVLLANSSTEVRIDMSLVTGMTTINVTDTSNESVEFYNMSAGTTIDVTATDTTNTTVEVVYTDDTSATDAQTFVVAAVSADDNVAIVIDDIETINISSDTAEQVDLSLAGVSMTAATARNTVNFTGTNDIELAATGADITTIDASGMGTGGALVQTGRTGTEAATYTGSAGDDTLIMMNAADTLNGGAGTGDTLDINMTQAVGTAIIDLSADDQIASFNGGANIAVQTGFENVNTAGVTLNGAVITGTSAANTLVGGVGVDQIDGGAGDDTISGGAGSNTLDGGAGTADVLDASDLVVSGADDGIVVNVSGSTVANIGTSLEAADGSGTAGITAVANNTVVFTIDSTNGSEAATQDISTISNFESYVLSAEADIFYGSSGVDTVDGGAGADMFRGGDGADVFTGGAGVDSFAIHSAAHAAKLIKDWASEDQVVFGVDEVVADDSTFSETVLGSTNPGTTIIGTGGSTLVAVHADDYVEIDATGTVVAEHINVLTDSTGAATLGLALDGQTTMAADNSDFIVVFYNSATSNVELWNVTDAGTAAASHADAVGTHMMSFENIAASGIAAAFDAGAFQVELIA
ncbi:hypothetical protein N9482_02805 [Planktomarina temperata]|nr:hypothetical protein [Planktomarina temperata]